MQSESAVEAVEQLLAEIPKLTMANASYHCNAFVRALLQLESQLREDIQQSAVSAVSVVTAPKGKRGSSTASAASAAVSRSKILAEHLPFLQKIYSKLDEPDGLAGIATLRDSKPSIEDEILYHENAGRWADALTCYDLALQVAADNLQYRLGLLDSLRNIGHFETMLQLVQGAIATTLRDHSTSSLSSSSSPASHALHALNVYGVQCAWRLANWQQLEGFLTNISPSESEFEVAVGR